MALSNARGGRRPDRTTTLELAAIAGNAARLGIPVWRVTTALDLSAAQRAEIEAIVGRDDASETAESQ
jgi:hypothetical protein